MLDKERAKIIKAVDAAQVAEFLSLHDSEGNPDRKRVLKYAREGKLPCHRLSQKCVRFYLDEVEAATRGRR